MTYTIQEIPLEERPREKLLRYGAEMLSSVELLTVSEGEQW
jgi:DNA repair protein RadC